MLAGRGFGKTKSAAEWVREEIESGRRRNIGLIGQTEDDTRKIMVEGISGILSVCPTWNKPTYEPSNNRIIWPNGGMAHLYTAEKPGRLRGPNLDGLWCIAAGQRVMTARGNVPIENIIAGDSVLTRSGMHLVQAAMMTNPDAEIWRLESSDHKVLLATDEHPIWTENQGFKPLKFVRPGDMLATCLDRAPQAPTREIQRHQHDVTQRSAYVVSVTKTSGRSPVYNLQVEGAHEFFAEGILVHNCDELCAWGSPAQAAEVYDMASMCLRIQGPLGDPPQAIITTTPKPMPLLKQIINDPTTVMTSGSTMDNAANLDASTIKYYRDKYEGTRLGRQELYGILLDSFEGALWSPAKLDENRLTLGDMYWKIVRGGNSGFSYLLHHNGETRYFRRIIVSIDPAGSANRKSNETGIMVCALGEDEDGYLLADLSGVYSPEQWGSIAVEAFHDWQADKIVAEQNYGGEMVASTIRAADRNVPVKLVVASKGKRVRAEPVSLLDEQGRIHHVGNFEKCEDQLVTWDPFGSGDSPDRLDARVWGFIELMLKRKAQYDDNRGSYRGVIPLYGR